MGMNRLVMATLWWDSYRRQLRQGPARVSVRVPRWRCWGCGWTGGAPPTELADLLSRPPLLSDRQVTPLRLASRPPAWSN